MFRVLSARVSFVVTCKQCRRLVPTGHAQFPFQSIMVACTLCHGEHRYRPSEIKRGRAEEYVASNGKVWQRRRSTVYCPELLRPRAQGSWYPR